MTNLGRSLVSLGGILAAMPAAGQLPSGCLDLVEFGAWRLFEPTAEQRAASLPLPSEDGYSVPARIELSPERSVDWGVFRLEVPETSQQVPYSVRTWHMSGDELNLRLSTGLSGVDAQLRRDGPVWQGMLRTATDNLGAPRYERSIVLAQADCASPPPIPASADPPLPRTIELVSGVRLEVGRPLPDGVETRPRPSGALTVVGEPTGIFAGATTIAARVNREAVAYLVELHFPADFDHDRLVERIDSAVATQHRVPRPMVVDGIEHRLRGASWRNRTTTVYVFPSSGDDAVRLILIDPRQLRRESAIDTAAAIRSALSRFPRANGPVAEIAGLLECRPTECRSMAADSVIAALASSWEVRVVGSDSGLPSCTWNTSPEKLPRGLRLQASEIRSFRGQPSVKVTARCAGGAGARHRLFFHEIYYKVERIDGHWTTTEVLAEGIT